MNERNWNEQAWQLSVKILLVIVSIVAAVWFINKITWVLSLLTFATLIVYSLSPLSSYLTKKGLPHYLSVLIVYFLLLFSTATFFYLLIPALLSEMRDLASYLANDYRYLLPQFITQIEELLINEDIASALQEFSMELPIMLQQAVLTLTAPIGNIFSFFTEAVIVLFIVFYMLRDLSSIKKSVLLLFPNGWRKEASHVLRTIDIKVGAYIQGNIVRCSIVGILTGVILTIIGMPFALMLGILAGILNIIVYIGPYLAGIPAVLLAFAPETPNPLIIIVLYVVIQAVDGFILTPLLLGRAVDLRPFTVIVSLLVGGKLLGFIGFILAIPVAATLKVVLYHYYIKEDANGSITGRSG